MYGSQCKGTESGRHKLNGDQGFTGSESHIEELVMDMGLIGLKKRLPVTGTAQHHADNIKRRYQQYAERNQKRRIDKLLCRNIPRIHAILDDKETEDISQCKATGIAHENFTTPVSISKDVVREERNNNAYTDKSQQRIAPFFLNHENYSQYTQSHHAQAGSQSIDTIDEIDGIGNEHSKENSERYPDAGRNLINPEQAIKIIDG